MDTNTIEALKANSEEMLGLIQDCKRDVAKMIADTKARANALIAASNNCLRGQGITPQYENVEEFRRFMTDGCSITL